MIISRALAAGGAAIVLVGAASGITYAATSGSSGTVHACANAKGVLALLNSHGHCPKHFAKVSISERGPRGKTGKRGPAGPGAIRLAIHSSAGLVTKESKPIGGTTLTVEVLCTPADEAQVYINLDAAGAPFNFEGTGSWDGTGTGSATWLDPTNDSVVTQSLGPTSEQVAAQQNGEGHSVEFTTTGGTVAANLLVNQGAHAFSVQLGAYRDATQCFSHALVTPAG